MLLPHTRFGPVLSLSGASRLDARLAGRSGERPLSALVGLDLTYHQFVDLCILLGCDYCDSIKGIGPVNGLKLIKQCGDLEGVIAHCEKKKIALPEPFPYAAQLWRITAHLIIAHFLAQFGAIRRAIL